MYPRNPDTEVFNRFDVEIFHSFVGKIGSSFSIGDAFGGRLGRESEDNQENGSAHGRAEFTLAASPRDIDFPQVLKERFLY